MDISYKEWFYSLQLGDKVLVRHPWSDAIVPGGAIVDGVVIGVSKDIVLVESTYKGNKEKIAFYSSGTTGYRHLVAGNF